MGKKDKQKKAARTTDIQPWTTASHLSAFSADCPFESASGGGTGTSSDQRRTGQAYYAQVQRAPDAHTLRIFNASSSKCVHRWTSAGAEGQDASSSKVSSIAWAWLSSSKSSASAAGDEEDEGDKAESSEAQRGKKRKKLDDASAPSSDQPGPDAAPANDPRLVLCVGMENGSIHLVALTGSRTTVLSHPSCSSAAVAMTSTTAGSTTHLWTAHSDGLIRIWDLRSESLIAKSKPLDGPSAPLNSIDVRYAKTASGKKKHWQATVVASREAIQIYRTVISPSKKGKVREVELEQVGQCSGHVERCSVKLLDTASEQLAFVSWSPSDRHVQVWSMASQGEASRAALVSRFTLDTPVHFVAVSKSLLAAVEHGTGAVCVTTLPSDFSAGNGITTLRVESKVETTEPSVDVKIQPDSSLQIAKGVVKPSIVKTAIRDADGQLLPHVHVTDGMNGLSNGKVDDHGIDVVPYSEHSTKAAPGAVQPARRREDEDEEDEDLAQLDVDNAEPTLADRLKALNVDTLPNGTSRRSDQDMAVDGSVADDDDQVADEDEEEVRAVPATTLTTTLIQALHSTDGPLLESCLAQTKPDLIRATVKRLPPGSLVLNLLEAIVERLGKGKKGAQRNASVDRSRGLIEWLRQVLMVHVSFLVTIPSLVQRLSSLHTALTARLELQPRLLALNGRLELVVSQIETRRERRQPLKDRDVSAAKAGRVYVEGESSSSESDSDASDDGEGLLEEDDEDDEEGSVEDIALGDDASDFDENDDEEDEDGVGGQMLDLEASEDEEEDDDEEDEDMADGAFVDEEDDEDVASIDEDDEE